MLVVVVIVIIIIVIIEKMPNPGIFVDFLRTHMTVLDVNGYWNQKMVEVLLFELSYHLEKNPNKS